MSVANVAENLLLAFTEKKTKRGIVYAMELLKILGFGLIILIGALLLNFIASRLSLSTWYDFVKEPKKADVLSLIWLFLIYPFSLGGIAYMALKIIKF